QVSWLECQCGQRDGGVPFGLLARGIAPVERIHGTLPHHGPPVYDRLPVICVAADRYDIAADVRICQRNSLSGSCLVLPGRIIADVIASEREHLYLPVR